MPEIEVNQGAMIEVWGSAIDIAYQALPKRRLLLMIQEKETGRKISAETTKTKRLRQFFRQYGLHYKEVDNLSEQELERKIEDLLEEKQEMLFRIKGRESSPHKIFAIATQRWKKVKIEMLMPDIKKAFKEVSPKTKIMFDVTPSTDEHGGMVSAWFPDEAIIQPNITISAGLLDAWNSLKIYGGCKVLSCSNQLSTEVRDELQPVIGHSFLVRKVHAGENLYEDMKAMITEAIEGMGNLHKCVGVAMKIDISTERLRKILTYYAGHNFLSMKIIKLVMARYKEEEKIGTLWGFIMALTYVGSNMEVKKTPERRLKMIGGELLIIASVYKKYTELVNNYIKKNKLPLIDLRKKVEEE